jgi:protein-S-isoprenylcysteine O-methyltransferase Ste14
MVGTPETNQPRAAIPVDAIRSMDYATRAASRLPKRSVGPLSPAATWLLAKMVIYAASFLASILGLVPYGFDWLGRLIFPYSLHILLVPGPAQQAAGLIVFGLGLLGYLFCSLWLVVVGKGPFVELDPPKELVVTGPYCWVRNPIAALLIVTVLGEATHFGSPGIFLLVLLGLPLAHWQVTRIEEPRLRTRFGESYAEYCRRVPRWLPRRPRKD